MRHLLLSVSLGLILPAGLVAPAGAADEPWDRACFEADPAALRAAVDAVPAPEDADVHMLLEEETYRFEADGRRTHTLRRVYHCITRTGAENWSYCEGEWSPWHEERPEIRARVITRDGNSHELDPGHLAEVPVDQDSRDVYTDRRMLRGPLPAVRAGAVVEEQVVTRETQPFFADGVVEQMLLLAIHPTRKIRLVLDAPLELPLRYDVRGIEREAKRTERGGRVRIEFEAGPLDEFEMPESFLPPDVPRFAQVTFSTGRSWAGVAAGYGEIVDEQLTAEADEQLGSELPGDAKDARTVAAAALAKIHRLVRCTGIEFGEAAIVPRTPRETLLRGFGDCKDQSTLLVAMFRAAGIEARVALLRSGRGEDVVPGLPGLAFNHAIVHVPGDEPLWIDPTARYVPVGELPIVDQGRWALVAGADTKQLVQTPMAPSTANRNTEVYEVTMSEWGGSRVRETVESTGAPAEASRSWYAASSPKELRENWKQYGEDTYATRSLESLEYSSPEDFSKPFRIVGELTGAKFGVIDDAETTVAMYPSSVFDRLPDSLRLPKGEPAEDELKESGDEAEDAAGREHALWLPEPHLSERRYRITPPPGFVPRELPESTRRQFGPVVISQEFSAADGPTVEAVFRLDTGDGRLQPDEAEALHEAILDQGVDEEGAPWEVILEFEHPAERALEEGRIQEGIAAYRELLDANPGQAEQRARYARALLRAGLGEAARREVRRAVELAPKTSEARGALGRIHTHDLLGRHFRRGMDRDTADRAYRKALELDPENLWARFDLAILLEHDDDGFRYSPTPRLDEAVVHYQKVREEVSGSADVHWNLALALHYAGKFAELEELVEDLEPVEEWGPLRLAAIAAQHGAAAGEKKAVSLFRDPDERRDALLTAADYLQRARLYEPARELCLAAAPGALNEFQIRSLADLYEKLQPREQEADAKDGPGDVVRRMFHAALRGGEARRGVRELFARTTSDADFERSMARLLDLVRVTRDFNRKEQIPPERTADAARVLKVTWEGDDEAGYRVEIADDGMDDSTWYVVREAGEYRILAEGPLLANLGGEALERVAAGDLPGARRWLGWTWDVQKDDVGWFNAFSGTPFARIWWTADHDDRFAVRLAAAALLAEGRDTAQAIPILLEVRENEGEERQQLQADRALARAFRNAGRPEKLLETAERVLAQSRTALEGLEHKVAALWQLGRKDELGGFLRSQLERTDLGHQTEEMLAIRAGQMGLFALSQEHLRPLVDRGRASPLSYNELAWNALFTRGADEEALEDARRANRRTLHCEPTYLHTLATVCAELGKTTEALENLHRSVDGRKGQPEPHDWYVLGRVAEHLGLPAEAAELYRKVPEPKNPYANDTWMLAKQRLEGLKP